MSVRDRKLTPNLFSSIKTTQTMNDSPGPNRQSLLPPTPHLLQMNSTISSVSRNSFRFETPSINIPPTPKKSVVQIS